MPTYTPLSSIQLTSSTNQITFSNISQEYQDLVLVFSGSLVATDNLVIRFNSDTGSNYSNTSVEGNGTTASSTRETNYGYSFLGHINLGTGQINAISNIMNYSNTTTNKALISRVNSAGAGVSATAGLWRSTSAINSITLLANNYFAIGSTVNLYGISPTVGSAKAFGGDEVYYDSTYVYHVFKSSGTFTPYQNITCDYLVVAGGGSGGKGSTTVAGGGGAGGMRCTVTATGGGGSLESALSLVANTAYTVTIGAGGAGLGAGTSGDGASGSNSVFSTITSSGGGLGSSSNGVTGGSGGAGGASTVGYNGAAGTANQGYAGGNGYTDGTNTASRGGGGGGGAGAVGANATSTNPTTAGTGGNGTATSISGSSVTYAGGGGGSARTDQGATAGGGGTGGGGAGGNYNATAGNGTANTGSGGGGASGLTSGVAGNGGGGIVIVRYAR